MRFYKDFPEAINELRRELKEMGIRVKTKSVQNLNIENNPDYEMMELQNYAYLVISPDFHQIPCKAPEDRLWREAEFEERVSGLHMNPGDAWVLRRTYWQQFLVKDGDSGRSRFDYSYPDRMADTLPAVIKLLKQDPNTRRAYLPIFDPKEDEVDNLTARIPCSLGYLFQYRNGALNMTYLLRSSDFFEHFNNDIWLASKLQHHVAQSVGMPVGNFCHFIMSFHCFAKNVKDAF